MKVKNFKIEKELKVYILQNNATGTREKREFIEYHWNHKIKYEITEWHEFKLEGLF